MYLGSLIVVQFYSQILFMTVLVKTISPTVSALSFHLRPLRDTCMHRQWRKQHCPIKLLYDAELSVSINICQDIMMPVDVWQIDTHNNYLLQNVIILSSIEIVRTQRYRLKLFEISAIADHTVLPTQEPIYIYIGFAGKSFYESFII